MHRKIFTKDKNYTFLDYFEMNHPTREILAAFDYQYAFEEITLPQTDIQIGSLDKLRDTYIKKLPFISLNSEAARDVWRFARLERREKLLKKDMNIYALHADLERIFSAVLGILGTYHNHPIEKLLCEFTVLIIIDSAEV